jgi:hypothetical protein
MKSLLDRSFLYTPVSDQGPDYLRMKFARIRAEQKADEAARNGANVQALWPKAGPRYDMKAL